MGIFKESKPGSSDWHVIADEKPKADWSGLEDKTDDDPVCIYVPTQKRVYGSKYEATKYEKRVKPMTTSFKEGMSLHELRETILEHAEKHSLDTWTYLGNPHDHNKMVSVVDEYSKFLAAPDDTVE